MLKVAWREVGIRSSWKGAFTGKVDLHFHSRFSDGSKTFPLAEMVELASYYGIRVIALTDHDTIAGQPEFLALAQRAQVSALTGVEISTSWGESGELHTLAYGFDLANEALRAALGGIQLSLVKRFESLAGWVNDNLRDYQVTNQGKISFPRLLAVGETAVTREEIRLIMEAESGGTFGRPHLAKLLLSKGYFPEKESPDDRAGAPAFRFLKEGTSLFPAPTIELGRAIELIHGAGGLAFMAHPFGKENSPKERAAKLGLQPEEFIRRLLSAFSYDGIEVVHSEHSPAETSYLTNLAVTRALLQSGGSDTHWKANDQRVFGITPESALAYQEWMVRS